MNDIFNSIYKCLKIVKSKEEGGNIYDSFRQYDGFMIMNKLKIVESSFAGKGRKTLEEIAEELRFYALPFGHGEMM
ncbi:hypothetical protein ACFDTO_29960 [Microbacteriaceae bacterium 4G12]